MGLSVALTAILPFSQAVQAASFAETQTEVDWLIHDDSFNDSIAGNDVGGTRYEIYSAAVQVVDNYLVLGINSNFSMDGTTSQFAHDRLVKFSDIILNCVDHMFGQAAQYAIHFDEGNESSVPKAGIYETPTLTSLAEINGNETGSFGGYNSYVSENGGTPKVGTLSNSYFDSSTHVNNMMMGGNWIGEAFTLSPGQLENLGLDNVFQGLPGTNITAIAADISSLQETGASCSFYLGQECNNDLTGGTIEIEKVPEPTSLLALAGLGVLLPMARRRKLAA
jgi:hypothetical protein